MIFKFFYLREELKELKEWGLRGFLSRVIGKLWVLCFKDRRMKGMFVFFLSLVREFY